MDGASGSQFAYTNDALCRAFLIMHNRGLKDILLADGVVKCLSSDYYNII